MLKIEKNSGGRVPGPLAALVPSALEEPPNFFRLPTALDVVFQLDNYII